MSICSSGHDCYNSIDVSICPYSILIYFSDVLRSYFTKWFNILDFFRALQKRPLFCILTWIIRMSFEFINRIERMVKFPCAHSQELHKLDFLLECCSTNFIKGLRLLQFTGGSGDVWKWKWICVKVNVKSESENVLTAQHWFPISHLMGNAHYYQLQKYPKDYWLSITIASTRCVKYIKSLC